MSDEWESEEARRRICFLLYKQLISCQGTASAGPQDMQYGRRALAPAKSLFAPMPNMGLFPQPDFSRAENFATTDLGFTRCGKLAMSCNNGTALARPKSCKKMTWGFIPCAYAPERPGCRLRHILRTREIAKQLGLPELRPHM